MNTHINDAPELKAFKALKGITYNGFFIREYTLRDTLANDFIFECLQSQEVGNV